MNTKSDWMEHCETEPLAYSGAIQPHGALLYLDLEQRVSHVSAQIREFLPYSPEILLGELLPPVFFKSLAPALKKLTTDTGSRSELFAVRVTDNVNLDIVVMRNNDGFVLELLQHEETAINISHPLQQIRAPRNDREILALHEKVAQLFHEMTDFDRVMIYAFREDGDGEVLAEARRPEVYGSYLGLRFPGSDIPLIARTLYLNNPWRLIPDSQAPAIQLLSNKKTVPDLTWSDLRSVSPMHQLYLKNMGVRASLSFPIIVAGELWGLIACHHSSPHTLPLPVLRAASRHASRYSLNLSTWKTESQMRFIDNLTNRFEAMQMTLLRHGDILSAIPDIAPAIFEQFNACGLAIRSGDNWGSAGIVPEPNTLKLVDEWFEYEIHDLVCSNDCMSLTIRKLELLPVSGVLALKQRTRKGEPLHLFIFRSEQLQEVTWGGNPQKPVEFHNDQIDIAPRRSFEKWLENRIGYSHAWSKEDRLAGLRLRLLLVQLYG